MNQILFYCRPGFEKDLLAEVTERMASFGGFGWANPQANSGFLLVHSERALELYSHVNSLVFARDAFVVSKQLADLDSQDRIGPVLAAAQQLATQLSIKAFGLVSCEYAEGDAYRSTSRFTGKFVHPVRQALRQAGVLASKEQPQRESLRLFFTDSSNAYVGYDIREQRPLWTMGISRLKFPPAAPSRSTLKLEEAFCFFLGRQWKAHIEQASTAVDLGAAPGGWTWQLVQRDIKVYAVDNGPMDAELMASGLVEHIREDGFVWTPEAPVDWLVCDMVEQPARVAKLMVEWLQKGYARQAIFNLKLPMKKRYQEWSKISTMMTEQISNRISFRFAARQLYHDREEITVFLVQDKNQ